jgi:anti-sigma factor RsiW
MDRDPTDQIDFGLPDIIGTGPQVGFQPTLAGNFNLTCYYDTNGNNSYDSGEELRVLRWASVRTQFVSDSSFIRSNSVFVGSSNGVSTGSATVHAMDLQVDVILEGGGTNAMIGVDRVTLGNVGTLWHADDFVVNYPVPTPAPPAPGNVAGTESENSGGPVPMVDTHRVTHGNQPTGGDTAFRANSQNNNLGAGPGGLGQIRRVVSFDSPAFGWDYLHPTTQNPWSATVNGNAFREFIAGFSTSFPRNYVVIAFGEYSVVANGVNSSGTWASNSTAAVTSTSLTNRVSTNFTPQVGNASGVQVLGLSFVAEVHMDHNP